jgi:hypothetical protein
VQHFYYNREGRPISFEQWTTEFERRDRRVALSDTPAGRVSTVFLALNHNWDDGPPLLFETMIFGGPLHEYMWRYTTEAEALEGHAFAVQALMFYKPAAEPSRPPLIHNGKKPRRKP